MAGNKYYVLKSNDSLSTPKYFIYEQNPAEYMVFHLDQNNPKVEKVEKEIEIKENTIQGIISNSLYESLKNNSADPELAVTMADIFAWSIDFYRLQKDDSYEIIIDEKYIDTTYYGMDKIKAIKFNHKGETFYAFAYQDGNKISFYDENGNSLVKAFLKSPVKFSRISSGYNLKRFHPVQKRVKAHLGTDYAAPYGTPILSVGDGVVVEAQFKYNNGNYVKIKHNDTYTTQYLHMSKFAKGITKGKYVRQGEIIGYVGSTGLATGPHVCFRFWKNGKQVNHLAEKFIASDPIKKEELPVYLSFIQNYKDRLDHQMSSSNQIVMSK